MSRREVGQQQSPVRIEGSITSDFGSRLLEIHYDRKLTGTVEKDPDGHGFHIRFPSNSSYVVLDRDTFHLVQFHFHSRSEHFVGQRDYPIEIHMVNSIDPANPKAQKAVIGVFLERDESASKGSYEALVDALPLMERDAPTEVEIDPHKFLPPVTGGQYRYYRYEGSLTTENPATGEYDENVSWAVMRDLVGVPSSVLDPLIKQADHPRRDLQDLNRRFILTNF